MTQLSPSGPLGQETDSFPKPGLSSVLVPIVVAVTGHRDLRPEDSDQLQRATADCFRRLKALYPASPIRLLSGLAEGADRLVARVALNESIELAAVLPMEAAEYERDFDSKASVDEFRRLMAQAHAIYVVQSSEDVNLDRTTHYARLGYFLVEHCDLLLALWDGEPSDKRGGTADVVCYRLNGGPRSSIRSGSYLIQYTGDVYHIATPRASRRELGPPTSEARILVPGNSTAKPASQWQPESTCLAIDQLNRDLRADAQHSAPQPLAEPLQGQRTEISSAETARFRAIDRLAIRFQTRTWRAFAWMLTLSLLALICLQRRGIDGRWSVPLTVLYVTFMIAAYGIYFWSKRMKLENRAFDYRAVAEGLRIQQAWRVAGLAERAADHYLGRQQGVLKWVRRALLNWDWPLPDAQQSDRVSRESMERALEDWVVDQRQFFGRSLTRQRRSHQLYVRAANVLVWLGFALSMLKSPQGWTAWLISLAAIPPMVAATLLVYAKTRAWSEQVNQYATMRDLYQTAEDHLRALLRENDLKGAQELLVELGQEALSENAEWLSIHRRRAIRSPDLGM
ncbi:MAG: hypothetical protein U0795_06390 [Pirellulales bacterium]